MSALPTCAPADAKLPPPAGQQWLKVATNGRPIGVDREKEVIRGFILAQEGPFKSEGRGEFDKQSLMMIMALAQAAPNGLKSRLAHPDESNDGIGKLLGRVKDPYMDVITVRESEGAEKTDPVACVRGDLYLSPAAHKASFDLAEWLMTAAETDPDAISSSLVLSTDKEFRIDNKGVPLRDADGNDLPPLWRPMALHAADVVDTGDAVDGLLSKQLTPESLDRLPNGVVFKAVEALDRQFAGKPREFVHQHCLAFLRKYLNRRYGEAEGGSLAKAVGHLLTVTDDLENDSVGEWKDLMNAVTGLRRAFLADPGSTIGGQDEPGAPDKPEDGDADNPYPGGPSNALHNGCRSTLAYHHMTLCRLCGEKMSACGCDHVEHESRVITMSKIPCAGCQLKIEAGELEAPGDGGPPDSPGKNGDTMPEPGPDASGTDLRRRTLTLLELGA